MCQIARDFQLNSFQLAAFAEFLQRRSLNDFVEEYACVFPISAFIIYQIFSNEEFDDHQIYQELSNQGGFTVLFNCYIYCLRDDKNVIQFRNFQINKKYQELLKLSNRFCLEKQLKKQLNNIQNVQLLKSVFIQEWDTYEFQMKIKRDKQQDESILKFLESEDVQTIIQAINRGDRIAFVRNNFFQDKETKIQWTDPNEIDEQQLLDKQSENTYKKTLEIFLLIIQNGTIPPTLLKEYKIYFPQEPEDSEESNKEIKPPSEYFNYWIEGHKNEVLCVDYQFVEENIIPEIRSLQTIYDRKKQATQTLTMKHAVNQSLENLNQENGYMSSLESLDLDEQNESKYTSDAEDQQNSPKQESEQQELIQLNRSIQSILMQQIIYMAKLLDQDKLIEEQQQQKIVNYSIIDNTLRKDQQEKKQANPEDKTVDNEKETQEESQILNQQNQEQNQEQSHQKFNEFIDNLKNKQLEDIRKQPDQIKAYYQFFEKQKIISKKDLESLNNPGYLVAIQS